MFFSEDAVVVPPQESEFVQGSTDFDFTNTGVIEAPCFERETMFITKDTIDNLRSSSNKRIFDLLTGEWRRSPPRSSVLTLQLKRKCPPALILEPNADEFNATSIPVRAQASVSGCSHQRSPRFLIPRMLNLPRLSPKLQEKVRRHYVQNIAKFRLVAYSTDGDDSDCPPPTPYYTPVQSPTPSMKGEE